MRPTDPSPTAPQAPINWQLRKGTGNPKLGKATWVVTLDRATCPTDCPVRGLKGGCYAEGYALSFTWNRVSEGRAKGGRGRWAGQGFKDLALALTENVPAGALLRIGDAGDPSEGGIVSGDLIEALGTLKARGVDSIVFTHSDPNLPANRATAARAADLGLALNFSGHSPRFAPEGLQAVATVTEDFWDGAKHRDGLTRCPAEYSPATCDSCRLCSRVRKARVGFTAHGIQKAAVEALSR